MAKQTGKQAKPKCGAGQSCGYACIAAHETCTETIDPTISKAAVEALRGHATTASATVASESTDFRGKSFAEVQSKFSANDAKHTIANSIVDHGDGITTQKVTLVASDGSGDTLTHTLLRMAAVPASEGVEAQPERIFTLADGAAKEYTDASKNNFWNESRDAAVRAAISLPADEAAEATDLSKVKPYSVVKQLGIGAFGAAELTDRGTVVKRLLTAADKSMTEDEFALDNADAAAKRRSFVDEAEMQSMAADAGVAPKVLAVDENSMEQELAPGRTLADYGLSSDPKDRETYFAASTGQLLKTLTKLHAAGVVHNDLHNSNIIVADDGSIKIIDYGMARKSESQNAPLRALEFRKYAKSFNSPAAELLNKSIAKEATDYDSAKLASAKYWGASAKSPIGKAAIAELETAGKTLETAYLAAISKPAELAAAAKPAPEPEPKAAEPEPKAAEKPPEPAEAGPDSAATSKARNEAIRILRTAAPNDRKKNGWDEDNFVRMFDPQRNPKAAEYWNELQSKDSPAAVRKVQKAWDDRGMKGDNGIKDNTLVELPKLVMMSKQTDKARTPDQIRQDRITNVTNSDGVKTARKAK